MDYHRTPLVHNDDSNGAYEEVGEDERLVNKVHHRSGRGGETQGQEGYGTIEQGEWQGVPAGQYRALVAHATRHVALALGVDIPQPGLPRYVEPLYIYLRYAQSLLMCVVLGLAFFERPSWCQEEHDKCNNTHIYMNSNLPKYHPTYTDGIEFVCLSLLFAEMGLRYKIIGRDFFFMNTTLFLQTVLLALLLFDTFISLIFPIYRAHIWLSPFIRPWVFVVMFPAVRATFWQIVRIIPLIFELLVLLVLLLVTTAWLGLILFFDQEDDVPVGGPQGKHYFDTFGNALLNMFTYLTTANSPDVRTPIYTVHRSSFWYFLVFMVLGLYFLLSFIFSTVYNSYKTVSSDSEKNENERRCKDLTYAFALLDKTHNDTVDVSVCDHVIEELTKYSTLPQVHDVNALLGQSDDTKVITLPQFLELFNTLSHLQLHPEEAIGKEGFVVVPPKEDKPGLFLTIAHWHSQIVDRSLLFQRVRAILFSPAFDLIIDALLIINGAFFALQTYLFIEDAVAFKHQGWVEMSETVEWTFTILWTIEMVLKICVLGFRTYCSSYKNLFDAFVTLTGLATSILLQWDLVTSRLVRVIMIVRCLRLMRLFTRIRKFRTIFSAIITLMPAFISLLGILIAQYYFFAFLGMRLFGGLMYVGNPDLVGTAYDGNGYYATNFNDFGSAVVLLYDLMILSNWYVYIDAIAILTNEASRVFFFMFWFFTNLLTLNLLVANILDVVSVVLDKEKAEIEAVKERQQQEQMEAEDRQRALHGADYDYDTPADSEEIKRRFASQQEAIRLANARASIELQRRSSLK
eukprot:TRINITY_DN9973_c0_g1_i1.p1 TRINITY_DN9973_c0_g1~~TRINITY_DN9973_c0_g1_i1.p1  ORF type:complete len:800 (+),score=91.40 TRINITY_DN9973_c0_g1_i1:11-2410(+)